jgi:hypothetical protein
LNGNFLQQSLVNNVGPVYAVAFAASNASVLYAVNGFNSRSDTQFDKKVYLISTKTGNLMGAIDLIPEIRTPHDLALTNDATEIYLANLNPPGVFKYALVNFNCNDDFYCSIILTLLQSNYLYVLFSIQLTKYRVTRKTPKMAVVETKKIKPTVTKRTCVRRCSSWHS